MNKNDLIDAVAQSTGQSKKAVGEVLDSLTSQISQTLGSGTSVTVHGFGTFEVRERAAREGRNPTTGAPIQIAASKSVAFKAAKKLKDAL